MAGDALGCEEKMEILDHFYGLVSSQILSYQSLPLGLFPLCTSEMKSNPEGHVRDNVYCAMCVWSLALAYRHVDNDQGRTYELEQSAVKTMRGILYFYMKQAHNVEKFKYNQEWSSALRCKFNISTAEITSDTNYPNLQIDSVSLYLLALVQMISSGLYIIFTADEVNFVQNLVYYIERAYRTADFGMWERGTRYHSGNRELNSSSIGMAIAALESINGFNIFGSKGVSWSVIHVDPDAHNRNYSILTTLLPRESNSKNTDAALLTSVSFPAFAIDDSALRAHTKSKVISKLSGQYGLRRFLRDGYGTALEDPTRKFYDRSELQKFAGIECEWPIFYAYLALDAIFQGDTDGGVYREKLQTLMVYTKFGRVIPKYYWVPKDDIKLELAKPGSVERLPNADYEENIFLWGQSLYIMTELLAMGLVSTAEVDPVGRSMFGSARFKYGVVNPRYSSFQAAGSDLLVQVCLISENRNLQANLATYGIETQTPKEIEPIIICPPNDLIKVYGELGYNRKLRLTGRPPRPIGSLGTSKVYHILGKTVVTYPLLLDEKDFYMSLDMSLLIDNIKTSLAFVRKNWSMRGRPSIVLYLREHNFRGLHSAEMVDFMAQLKTGEVDGVKVKLGRLQTLVTSGCNEHLDFLHVKHGVLVDNIGSHEDSDYVAVTGFESVYHPVLYSDFSEDRHSDQFRKMMESCTHDLVQILAKVTNLTQQMCILETLLNREGPAFTIGQDLSVTDYINNVYLKACYTHNWSVVRHGAGLMKKSVDSLAPSITSMLVSGKQVSLGVFGHKEHLISEPLTPAEIKQIIFDVCLPVNPSDAVLQQELVIYLAKIISTQPKLFKGMLKIRVGWFIEAMKNCLASLQSDDENEKPKSIYSLYPSGVKQLLTAVLLGSGQIHGFDLTPKNMLEKRKMDGALNRVPPSFYKKVWYILARVPGGLRLRNAYLPQKPVITEMTVDEADFKSRVEDLLIEITSPVYRQIAVELIMIVGSILDRNPELLVLKTVDLGELVAEAMVLHQRDSSIQTEDDFYNLESGMMATYLARAVVSKVLQDSIVPSPNAESCKVS